MGGNKLRGSLVFENVGTQRRVISFFTASKVSDVNENTIEYPQRPLDQTWMVDFPLLAYKTFTPRNREIAVLNLAQNAPVKIIYLGEWEFICFVNHSSAVEQKLFNYEAEINCNIMMLVRRQ